MAGRIVLIIRTHFENEEQIREYINECENRFTRDMNACTELLLKDEGVKFITLSGPTCSGKTTSAHIIVEALEGAGHRVKVVSIDDFFLERDFLNSKEKLDYDSVETIDLALLKEVIDGIEDGREVLIPHFDFGSGHRTHYDKYTPINGGITIFEGIQALYPQVSSLFDKNDTLSIYISVAQDMCFDGVTVDARTVRLIRRLSRDCESRGVTPDFTLTLWASVCENEDSSIFPYKDTCDYKLDSLLGYELSVLKESVLSLLSRVASDSVNSTKARELEQLLHSIQAVDASFVPECSLLNEFI